MSANSVKLHNICIVHLYINFVTSIFDGPFDFCTHIRAGWDGGKQVLIKMRIITSLFAMKWCAIIYYTN